MEPKIRFKGYMFGWVSEAIGLYYNFKNGLNKSKEYFGFGTPIVNFTDVFNNRVLDYASLKGRVFVTKEEIANYSVQKGDLFFTRTSETLEEIGYPSVMLSDSPQTVYSGFVLRGRAINNDPLVDVFKSYVFFTTSFRKEMIRKSSMTTRALTSGNRLKEMIFTYPKAEDEQFKIGNYFLTLDNKIQTTSKKLESLKKLKSASLVAMFPQQGKTTPKVRFKGFEGEWKKVKLGNVCSVNRGTRITKKELNTNQSYPVYQNTNYPLGYYKNYNVEANNPYVIIGGSAGLIGFSNVPFWAADDCAYFGDNDSLDKAFLYSTLLSHIAEIKKNVRGSSVPRLDRSTLIDLEINLPSFSEQQAIASFFHSLDRKIALETARLEKLKQIKLACLDKMFV